MITKKANYSSRAYAYRKVVAKDRKIRHITVCTTIDEACFLVIGVSISTHELFDKERGKQISEERALTDRTSLTERGLRFSLPMNGQVGYFLGQRKQVIKAIAEEHADHIKNTINEIIWKK